VHRQAIEKQAAAQQPRAIAPQHFSPNLSLLQEVPGADDERAELAEDEVTAEEDAQVTAATQIAAGQIAPRELELLAEMGAIAQQARHQPDGRILKLRAWIQTHLCPELGTPGATWTNRRVVIFT
jgi:hypothetical protein